jgi:hypothetical protein
MHRLLLGAAAASIAAFTSASPALAQGVVTLGGLSSTSVHRALPGLGFATHGRGRHGDFRHGGNHFHHIHVGDGMVGAGWGYGGYDGYDYYDVNASWQPDSFNGWWHDRPDRAYPRWMARNRDCARPWFSGDTLTC